jgi:transcriptional regulator with XRE-family HTH domain
MPRLTPDLSPLSVHGLNSPIAFLIAHVQYYANMPRIATKISLEVTAARAQLRAYLAGKGRSQVALASISGVHQYTISKFLGGRIKTLTPDVLVVLSYADIGIKYDLERLLSEPLIRNALGNAWDGTDEGIRILATTINALAPVIRSATPNLSDGNF